MRRNFRRPPLWVIVLAAVSITAWSSLLLGVAAAVMPELCASGALPLASLPDSLATALAFNAPSALLAGWVLMWAAMMLPATAQPLRHVRDRSLSRRRGGAMLLFAAAHGAVWLAAGLMLQLGVLSAVWAAPLLSIWFPGAVLLALLWQVSPAKQWSLNRCHRRPPLAAFGPAADRDVLLYGLSNGAACVGVCWALMLPMLLAGPVRMPAMIAIALFVFAERLEAPAPLAWRWRGGARAARIVAVQTEPLRCYLRVAMNSAISRVSRSSSVLIE